MGLIVGMAAPVGWFTWLSKALPDETEAGGGLMVAVIQVAITAGAASGGVLFDSRGYQTTVAFSALVFCASAAAAFVGLRHLSTRGLGNAPKECAAVGN